MGNDRQRKPGGSLMAPTASSSGLAPGKRTLTESLVVQRRASRAASADEIHQAATAGTATPAASLPYLDKIQASFGPAHDVSSIQAHVGGITAASCEDMGATAFATGNHVAFASTPDLHTTAHEAAHVVQQAEGVNLYGGVGHADDQYEQHADAVADRVVAGESAVDLLPVGAARSQDAAVQRKASTSTSTVEQPTRATSPSSTNEIDMPAETVTRPPHAVDMPASSITGDSVADRVTAGGLPSDDPTKFLDDPQRQALAQDGARRWTGVANRCGLALNMVRAKELMRPEDPPPLWAAALLEAATIATMTSASAVIESARSKGEALLEDAKVWANLGAQPNGREKAVMALASANSRSIDAALELGVATGSMAAEKGNDSNQARVGEAEKAGMDEILSALGARLTAAFQTVGEQPPARDADLIAWYHLADAKVLTQPLFEQAFNAKVAQLRAAHLTDIGTTGAGLMGTNDTVLQWRKDQRGTRRLAMLRVYVPDGCATDLANSTFLRWVPPDMEESAVELAEARGSRVYDEGGTPSVTCEPDYSAADIPVPL